MVPTPRATVRQTFPDQLRGLALLGIIVVNAPFLAISADGYTAASVSAPIDWAAAFAVTLLAQGKFYLIFSFLFGYSANFIVPANGTTGRRRFRRRLVGLAVIGLAHAVLLFVGDILLSYALLGAALMLMFSRSDRAVLRTSAIAAVAASLWLGVLAVAASSATSAEFATDPALLDLDAALAHGSFLDAALARAEALPATLLVLGTLQWGLAFSAFCLGLLAGRHRALSDLAARSILWRRLALWGLLIGVPVQAWAAWLTLQGGASLGTTAESFLGLAVGFLTAPILAAGYVGALALLALRFPRALAPVQDSGRASLTLYLGESLVLSTLFCGYGFGLFGTLHAAAVAGVAIVVWGGLEVAVHLWLRRFRQGPLEWLLSRWTNATPGARGDGSPSPGASAGAAVAQPVHAAKGRRRWRPWVIGVVTVLAVVVSLGGVAVVQNDYDIDEQHVSIPFGPIALDGVLATPPGGQAPLGLVIFVHGDGPVDATDDSFYRPIWESFARAGYASLSWNKQGVDGSAGNWLHQSMEDRAAEVEAAIAWASRRPDIDPKRIGLWGASQGGWVIPKVARQTPGLCFMIAVSPAINWGQQGRYNTVAELRADGASQVKIDKAIAKSDRARKLLEDGATFEEYRAAVNGDIEGMTANRWTFISKNFRSDATQDLKRSDLRVFLILADHDLNVDVADTREVYTRVLPPDQLEVKTYAGATHALVKKDIADSALRTYATGIFNPRGLFAAGFLSDQEAFVEQSTKECG